MEEPFLNRPLGSSYLADEARHHFLPSGRSKAAQSRSSNGASRVAQHGPRDRSARTGGCRLPASVPSLRAARAPPGSPRQSHVPRSFRCCQPKGRRFSSPPPTKSYVVEQRKEETKERGGGKLSLQPLQQPQQLASNIFAALASAAACTLGRADSPFSPIPRECVRPLLLDTCVHRAHLQVRG